MAIQESTSTDPDDPVRVYEVRVLRSTRQSFAVQARDDDEAYDRYRSGHWVARFDEDLGDLYEATIDIDEPESRFNREELSHLLGSTNRFNPASPF